MNVKIIYLLVFLTLFNLCVCRKKSGLYPNQNNNDETDDSDVEYNSEQQNQKKSGINNMPVIENQVQDENNNENNQNQSQEENQAENQENQAENQDKYETRHQYKLSFKRPYYYYNDTNIVPNWAYSGDVIPAADMIRLVPSVPNRKGSIWSILRNSYNEWQIVMSFRVTGRSFTGSQGLALFYTKEKLKVDTFYGGEHQWDGLAIIFDSQNTDSNSHVPTINVLYNDGSTIIQSQRNYNDIKKSTCVADFRNSPIPVFVRITYSNKNLKVEVDLSHEGNEYYECSSDNIELPNDNYFGITARTADSNADDHDVLSFDFYQLNPPPKTIYYRPMEEEIIEREGEFQIDEDTLQQIKVVQDELVKEEKKKQEQEYDQEKNINARTVQITQYRILETVNRIFDSLQNERHFNGDSNNNETFEEMNSRSEQLMSDVSEIYDSLENLKQKVDSLNDSVERDSQKNEYKFNSIETKINQKITSEMNKVINELKNVKEENRKLKESINYVAKETKNQPNIWLVVFVSFIINMLGIYIITRVLPSKGGYDYLKTHNY